MRVPEPKLMIRLGLAQLQRFLAVFPGRRVWVGNGVLHCGLTGVRKLIYKRGHFG